MGIMKHIFSLLLVLIVAHCFAQPDPDPMPSPPPPPGPVVEEPLVFPEVMPAYPGGETQMFKDISTAMIYPPLCL